MNCSTCNLSICSSRCPYYISPQAKYYCSDCGEGIYEGEEYIVNEDNEYRHYDCFYGMKDLAEWLGYKVQTMN